MSMKSYPLLFAILLSLCGCTTSPEGSSWALADFNKYGQNYAPLNAQHIKIGQEKKELLLRFGDKYTVVEAGAGYEIIAYQKWKSVPGPDYVENTLYIRIEKEKVAKWKITNDTVEIVQRSW